MLTRLKHFIAQFRYVWRITRTHLWLLTLTDLVTSDTYRGAVFAVQKSGLDTSLKGAHNEHLRREAIEWAGHWYREQGLTPSPWEVRVCIELAVGKLKGYLTN